MANAKTGKSLYSAKFFVSSCGWGRYAGAEFGYGLVLLREGEAEEAERVVRHGLEADPDSVDGHVVLGFVLLKLDRPDEAEKHAREAIGSNATNSPKGYLVLSDVDAAAGNYDREVCDLDTYLKLRPNDLQQENAATRSRFGEEAGGKNSPDRKQLDCKSTKGSQYFFRP
jgi:tetratricopeptide (TPR) repeat protein